MPFSDNPLVVRAFQIGFRLQQGGALGDVLVVGALIERLDQDFLRGEVVVRVTEGDPRFPCDGAHRGLLVTPLLK